MKITLGADPELFLLNKRGWPRSAHPYFPGGKKDPFKLKHGAVQVDGTAAEFNIDPASSAEEFAHNIASVLAEIQQFVPKGYTLVAKPTVQYLRSHWRSIPDDCKVLGCDPDYTNGGGLRPVPEPKARMRHGGGHIHIGWTNGKDPFEEGHFQDCLLVSERIGNLLRRVSWAWDNDQLRRNLFDTVAFRPKPYGVELRELSNAWVNHPALWPWLFNMIQYLVDKMKEGKLPPGIWTRDRVEMNRRLQKAGFENNLLIPELWRK